MLKLNGDRCSLSGSAFQLDLRFVVSNCVFNDGKSQAGTAGGFGVAFIYPVEPLKDPVFMLGRNTNAGIADNQAVIFCLDRHAATGDIILDGIFAEVIDHFMEHSADTFDPEATTSNIDLNAFFRGTGCQNFLYIFRKLTHIHLLGRQFHTFIHLG